MERARDTEDLIAIGALIAIALVTVGVIVVDTFHIDPRNLTKANNTIDSSLIQPLKNMSVNLDIRKYDPVTRILLGGSIGLMVLLVVILVAVYFYRKKDRPK